MKSINYILLLIIFSITTLSASNDSLNTSKYGIYGGINLNTHSADFYKLRGIPNCCPNFESGSGIGFNAGLLYELKLANDFWLGARLGVMTLDGELIKEEPTTIILETGPAEGIFEHRMTGMFMNAGLEPSIIYTPIKKLNLSAGARIGYNVTSKYDQIEEITEPAGFGTFMDSHGNDTHSRIRNDLSGDIPDAIPLQAGLVGSVSYELPLNSTGNLLMAPEISYYLGLTEMVENTDWKANSIRLSVAIKWSPVKSVPKEEIFRQIYQIDTIRIESDKIAKNAFKGGVGEVNTTVNETDSKIITTETIIRTDTLYYPKVYTLDGNISAVGVDSTGKEIENPVFVVEEFVSNRLDPLLNYVFFDDNSSELPGRYKTLTNHEISDFSIDNLYRESTLDIYYNLLNIVGKRLTQNPEASITIIGCNADIGEEKSNINLSQRRAQKISDYFINTWGIDKNRIKIQSRNLPEKASTPYNELEKIEENRRVEFYSDNYEILKPVFKEKIDRKANPPKVRFKLKANSEAGLKNWQVIAFQNSDQINKFEYKKSGEIEQQIEWELAQYQKITPKTTEPVIAELHLEDLKGNKDTSETRTKPIKVITIKHKRQQRIGDYEIEKFSLILFDFASPDIDGNNKKIVEFIKSRTKPESEIVISGYTDRTGDDDYNQKLSERRANAAKKAIGRKDAQSQGIGEQKLLYDNELPEGRFYCRTVEIEVRTKIK